MDRTLALVALTLLTLLGLGLVHATVRWSATGREALQRLWLASCPGGHLARTVGTEGYAFALVGTLVVLGGTL